MSVYDFEEQGLLYVGSFELGREAIVTDPCYEYGIWCQEIIDVVPGRYDGFVAIDEASGLVSQLIAVHMEGKYVYPKFEYCDAIGVDSGQASIFDAAYYQKNIHGYEHDYYEDICDLTLNNKFGVWDDDGIVSSSGAGDGGYPVYVDTLSGPASAIRIDFLLD